MKTIEYRLKSNPEKGISVPQEYAKIAEELISFAEESKVIPGGLRHKIGKREYLRAKGILFDDLLNYSQKYSKGNPDLKLKDKLYLNTCFLGINRELKKGNLEYSIFTEDIINAIEKLK